MGFLNKTDLREMVKTKMSHINAEIVAHDMIDTVDFILRYAECWNFWYFSRISNR